MGKIYKSDELMARYSLSSAAFRKYVNAKLDVINEDGKHAWKQSNEWLFDEVAVRKLDSLRGYGTTIVEKADDSEEVLRLRDEISTLKTTMLGLMKELADAQGEAKNAYKELADAKILALESKLMKDQLIKVEEEAAANKSAAIDAQCKLSAITNEHNELKLYAKLVEGRFKDERERSTSLGQTLQAENARNNLLSNNITAVTAKNQAVEERNSELQKEVNKLRSELEEERTKSLWQRIFGK